MACFVIQLADEKPEVGFSHDKALLVFSKHLPVV
jgi:hypothetical protein